MNVLTKVVVEQMLCLGRKLLAVRELAERGREVPLLLVVLAFLLVGSFEQKERFLKLRSWPAHSTTLFSCMCEPGPWSASTGPGSIIDKM